jgi:hypothetical protein
VHENRAVIRLDDNSEVSVEKAEVASVTRELHPGYPHNGQWTSRIAVGAEVAFITAIPGTGLFKFVADPCLA